DAQGQLIYPVSNRPEAPWVPEVYGDALLVNGKLFPYLDVEPRPYRFRVLNASNARFYSLSLSNRQRFAQIGTDQGLLASPAFVSRVTLAPAERADCVIDFSNLAGQRVLLRSQAFELLEFRVASGRALSVPLPSRLSSSAPRLTRSAASQTRQLTLGSYLHKQLIGATPSCDQLPDPNHMLMLLGGKRWRDPVTEKPQLGSVEIWEFMNLTDDTHPIHLHLVRFVVLERQKFDADEYKTKGQLILIGDPVPPAPNEAGWKDTVQADPGVITRILVPFEGYAGRYVWHCHVLEHAANEMMRPFEVVG
ncbi:MAG TPA: multicopper oxidase domain-containing protein, partial [Polyangiaceae bacterium]|nr:multicopper oxidase domain-containing protein [Polyangiaceae bacterium]